MYPDRKLVEWMTATERHLLTMEETVSGSDVLPDFILAVRDLFDV